MDYDEYFKLGERTIGFTPTYFIADIGANHDGELSRAKRLIVMAKEAGADCAKFQHFQASKIVSAVGFDGFKTAHQRGWDKSVFEVYEDYSINPDWNEVLAATCDEVGIDFMTTPYDLTSVDQIDPLVKAYKVGSGDITYGELIHHVASKGKPVFLATGASTMDEVEYAVTRSLLLNRQLVLMQCNTNYTGEKDNLGYVNLLVLKTYAQRWPGLPLGLSDHTHGHATALGAIALGARVIEKHFTDDATRIGPDHAFAMEPHEWKAMVVAARELESALGDGMKKCEENETESRIVQRRALRLKRDLAAGVTIEPNDLEALRPCPNNAYTPAQVDRVVGSIVRRNLKAGDDIIPYDIFE